MTLQEIRDMNLPKVDLGGDEEAYKLGDSIIVVNESAVELRDKKGRYLAWDTLKGIKDLERWEKYYNMTFGEQTIRVDYIPGNNSKVQNIKEKLAKIVDQVSKNLPLTMETTEVYKHLQIASMYLDRILP